MKFSLIICTYQRPQALLRLLASVEKQRLYPDQLLIIDGSKDDRTETELARQEFRNLEYYRVKPEERGLTRQRNYGLQHVKEALQIVCFLDDDIVLTPHYFRELIGTYENLPDAVGVGGYILDETAWKKKGEAPVNYDEFEHDGWVRKLGSRNVLRKKLGLLSDQPPGYMPESSNGFSTGFLPPSGKVYPVEFFMGGVASYRRSLFDRITFSEYFEGYGLYEDMDFCLRASEVGQLYVNTGARLYHYHETGGRPNRYSYGKMVVRNGWYVWRVKHPRPALKARFKWNATALLLSLVRAGNVISTGQRKEAFTETIGRFTGWWILLFNKPRPPQ